MATTRNLHLSTRDSLSKVRFEKFMASISEKRKYYTVRVKTTIAFKDFKRVRQLPLCLLKLSHQVAVCCDIFLHVASLHYTPLTSPFVCSALSCFYRQTLVKISQVNFPKYSKPKKLHVVLQKMAASGQLAKLEKMNKIVLREDDSALFLWPITAAAADAAAAEE
jgi:hypothetical protein